MQGGSPLAAADVAPIPRQDDRGHPRGPGPEGRVALNRASIQPSPRAASRRRAADESMPPSEHETLAARRRGLA
jgi:hypothetical protein